MLVALILVGPRFNPWDQHLFNKLIDDGVNSIDMISIKKNMIRKKKTCTNCPNDAFRVVWARSPRLRLP